MSVCRHDEKYWQEKLAAFLHDPPDKALKIYGHVSRAKEIRDEIYVTADEALVDKADQVASGLDRTFLPDSKEGGFIDFIKYPIITHPTGLKSQFPIGHVSQSSSEDVLKVVRADEKHLPLEQPLKSFALFHYFRHVFPYRLAREKTCGLTWQWFKLPADTRVPDHTIWQHCSLTSALYSCYAYSPEKKASIMVFSITPVQDFIASSRKLRDHWISSLILSWLAAEGMRTIILEYGSDHIIYPWTVRQPLIEFIVDEICGFAELYRDRYNVETRAATLPNKFVFLLPTGQEDHIAERIQVSILNAWKDVSEKVIDLVNSRCFGNVPERCLSAFYRIFERQITHFWEFHWSASPLIDEDYVTRWKDFLPSRSRMMLEKYLKKAKHWGFPYLERKTTERFFYPLSYSLVQLGLATRKLTPENRRVKEPGIKCHLHTDLEALRFSCVECAEEGKICELEPANEPDPNPRPSLDPCWKIIRKGFPATEFKETERLSAIGLVKRLIYLAVPEKHPLHHFFKDGSGFPSTIEIAVTDWLRNEMVKSKLHENGLNDHDVVEFLHRQDSSQSEWDEVKELSRERMRKVESVIKKISDETGDSLKVVDRYYALLVMDGDRMGRLLGGGFSARWRDVLHPELVKRMENETVGNYSKFWKQFLDNKRILSPSIHGAISQSLAEYALNTVPNIVSSYSGRLIYAGGDDICAMLPVSTAAQCARHLARAYNWAFVKKSGTVLEEVREGNELSDHEQLLLHLGPGEEISISAGLFIVHHKWPLKAAIKRAHELLESAKDAGRAAMAVSLQRRAGGERTFVAGFRDVWNGINVWDAFEGLVRALARREISYSFVYRLAQLEDGSQSLMDDEEAFIAFVEYQLGRSIDQKSRSLNELSRLIASLILNRRVAENHFNMRSLITTEVVEIAAFIVEAVRRKI